MEIERFTASYTKINENFLFQFPDNNRIDKISTFYKILCVIKNLFQRGNPLRPSEYLKKALPPLTSDISKSLTIVNKEIPEWDNIIKGGDKSNPALQFYKDIPKFFENDFPFLQRLIIPEAYVKDIIEDPEKKYQNQQVDFYIPAASLVIEIDGYQHKDQSQRIKDVERDNLLRKNGIAVHRIQTELLQPNNSDLLHKRLSQIKKWLEKYKEKLNNIEQIDDICNITPIQNRINYEIVLRYELLIISLMQHGYIGLREDYVKIKLVGESDRENLFQLAYNDVHSFLENLCQMTKTPYKKPVLIFSKDYNSICIDCNLFRFPDNNIQTGLDIIYIRNDPYLGKDWFHMALAKPIDYKLYSNDLNTQNNKNLEFFLKNIFGYDKFNPGQEKIIERALSRYDTLGILPTSGGKSLCYQLSCILQPCVSFVVCPLVSLCIDQKKNLDEIGITRTEKILSASDNKHKLIDDLAKGRYFFVWITPERFQNEKFREKIFIKNRLNFCYAVIDEAHCLSEWGHDFRTSYLVLIRTLQKNVPDVCLIGLTATISSFVLRDLTKEFNIDYQQVIKTTSLDRPNLQFNVDKIPTTTAKKEELFRILEEKEKMDPDIFSPNSNNPYGGIIFFTNATYTNNSAERIGLELKNKYPDAIEIYHAGILNKDEIQNNFTDNKIRLLASTKAFGMGVNKKNIRYTIHYGLPESIESFYQEAGRAGRDNKPAICTIIYQTEPPDEDENVKICFSEDAKAEDVAIISRTFQSDLGSPFYLLSQSYKGIESDSLCTYSIYNKILTLQNNKKPTIQYSDKNEIKETLGIYSRIETEKALYRLLILGIVDDWVIDYNNNCITIIRNNISFPDIKSNFLNYIQRYEPEKENIQIQDLSENMKRALTSHNNKEPGINNYIHALVIWQYENIYYQRRTNIRNMMEACNKFANNPIEFKKQICNFLSVNTITDLLDQIIETPWDIAIWFKILKSNAKRKRQKNEIHIKYNEIKLSCERYFESYKSVTGLDLVYSISCAMCNEFTDRAKYRFSSAIDNIYNNGRFNKKEITIILDSILETIKSAEMPVKCEISEQLINKDPKLSKGIYEKINDYYSLNFILNDAILNINEIMEKYHVRS